MQHNLYKAEKEVIKLETENNGQNNMFNDIQKITAFSQLFGDSGPNPEDMKKTLEMARKLSSVMSIINDKDNDDDKDNSKNSDKEISSQSKSHMGFKPFDDKSIGIINAAIPFMDKDMQKGIIMAVKLFEVRKLNSESKIYTQSIEKFDKVQKRKHMLTAIAPYLNPEERRRIKMIMKIMDMSKVMNT